MDIHEQLKTQNYVQMKTQILVSRMHMRTVALFIVSSLLAIGASGFRYLAPRYLPYDEAYRVCYFAILCILLISVWYATVIAYQTMMKVRDMSKWTYKDVIRETSLYKGNAQDEPAKR